LATAIPKIKSNYEIKSIIQEKLDIINEKIEQFEEKYCKYFNDTSVQNQIAKVFTPSKTANSGLAFVTKDEENNLCKKDQPEEILNVFRIIYLVINEDLDSIPPNKLIDNLINSIMPRVGVDSLSKKFIYLI
jgi:hypothetical protein